MASAADASTVSGQTGPRITILGGGPAGVGAAYMLATSGKAKPVLLERATKVGGNSGSFLHDGVHCDFGSHRLHPASDPAILDMIRGLLGDDLLTRPRHGRIRLKGSWIHFPLKPADLLMKMPKGFALSLLKDMGTKPFRKGAASPEAETFATILHKELGPAMCEGFYYPYMKKLWALPPEQLAVTLARRRISGSSITKIIKKVLGQLPGIKKPQTGIFYYPRLGFGLISEALLGGAEKLGAQAQLGASVMAVEHENGHVRAVRYATDASEQRVEADHVWSTIPLSQLVRMAEPAAPAHVLAAADKMRYRGMILIYITLDQDQYTEYDAHYFPELNVPISRLSEPKNYSASLEPRGQTVLCAELPCDPHEELWSLTDDQLGQKLCDWLVATGLPKPKLKASLTRRLSHAYPVYDRDFEQHFAVLDQWVGSIKGLLTFGRQGLFAHDNTHHALAMSAAAVECIDADGKFDSARWAEHRKEFEHHVVED
ncbi:MAG: FAD-dependent oxidoreductase [Sphingobium sp.]|jgi:protoporphyrinogen oxidase|nr:FAD-dependent oxidoreductase [Sphingobium sp.]MCI1271357.1 FAD-dependent oxidoreductase [Sphingobium sp.]MCI1756870.1 FAD-dependent oxidoreductase [Sphingobium sp.]MCI2053990.1 FAD-dependent oxidoreductase [Sphingobium sp.]